MKFKTRDIVALTCIVKYGARDVGQVSGLKNSHQQSDTIFRLIMTGCNSLNLSYS